MAEAGEPFSSEDIEKILNEEASKNEAEGWHFVKRTEFAELWKKDDPDSPIKLFKAFLRFPGISCEDLIEMTYNLDIRRKWDKNFSVIELVEEKPGYNIVYWRMKMPPGLSDRDVVQYMKKGKDEERNFHYIIYKNATDDRKPELPKVVRAKTILSGLIIRPMESEPNSSKVTIFMQNDPMGLIPKSVTNLVAAKGPIDWHGDVTKFYHEVYSKEKA